MPWEHPLAYGIQGRSQDLKFWGRFLRWDKETSSAPRSDAWQESADGRLPQLCGQDITPTIFQIHYRSLRGFKIENSWEIAAEIQAGKNEKFSAEVSSYPISLSHQSQLRSAYATLEQEATNV